MLIQFSVENYLSIKDKVVLSLLSSRDNEHPEHLIADGNKNYLKSAVIYGANASGKSNVLNAFWFMVNYVLTSHNQQLHKTIARSPFKFDPETPARPSSFEVIFTTEGVRYAYTTIPTADRRLFLREKTPRISVLRSMLMSKTHSRSAPLQTSSTCQLHQTGVTPK